MYTVVILRGTAEEKRTACCYVMALCFCVWVLVHHGTWPFGLQIILLNYRRFIPLLQGNLCVHLGQLYNRVNIS